MFQRTLQHIQQMKNTEPHANTVGVGPEPIKLGVRAEH